MKIPSRVPKSRARAFTVLEMTMAMAMALGIAVVLLGLLQQQISFTQALNDFRFLRDEAPQVNTLLTNIVNKADNYRIHTDYASAKSESGAVRNGSSLRLRFRHPDGTADHAIVSFETVNGEDQLNYYFRDKASNSWPSTPTWTISKSPSSVTFDNNTGILLITLTGNDSDEITYAGNPD